MNFSEEQKSRYARQLVMDEIGESGQQKLLNSKVLVIGAGGLGSPACMYLASAGVGTIGIADADEVELSNLQRQILHTSADVGEHKVQSAKETLEKMNGDVKIIPYQERITEENITQIMEAYDFIIDATDNFKTKFLINDACVKNKKPFSHAGIVKMQGQLMTYVPGKGACYRCVFGSPPPEDETTDMNRLGVLGVAAGVIGSLQAAEAIKYLVGAGELLIGSMLTCDLLTMKFRKIKLPKPLKECPACGGEFTYIKQ